MRSRSPSSGRRQPRRRYAAKLLFQFRIEANGKSPKRRICEERIVVMHCPSANDALAEARRSGEAACFSYRNSDGSPVHFEFVGVLDLLKLGPECNANEVWYEILQMVNPMERRREILPTQDQLVREADGPRQKGVTKVGGASTG